MKEEADYYSEESDDSDNDPYAFKVLENRRRSKRRKEERKKEEEREKHGVRFSLFIYCI